MLQFGASVLSATTTGAGYRYCDVGDQVFTS